MCFHTQQVIDHTCQLNVLLSESFFTEFKHHMQHQRALLTFIDMMRVHKSDRLSEQLDELADALASIDRLARTTSPEYPKAAILCDATFMQFVHETSSSVIRETSQGACDHCRRINEIVMKMYGRTPPTVDTVTALVDAGTHLGIPFAACREGKAIALTHIDKISTVFDKLDFTLIITEAKVVGSFLPGAFGFALMFPVLPAINAVRESHTSVVTLAGAEFQLQKLIMPNIPAESRKQALANLTSAIGTALLSLRAAKDALDIAVKYNEADRDIKNSILVSDASMPSDCSWISLDTFHNTLGVVRDASVRQRETELTMITKFVTGLDTQFVDTMATLEHALSCEQLDAWNDQSIKKACMTPSAVGLSGFKEVVTKVHDTLLEYADVDTSIAALKPPHQLSKATRMFSSVTAVVGLFRSDNRQGFCAKLETSLCKPGAAAIPSQLAARLKKAAAGEL